MKIDLPLEVYYSKNKKFILNLNNYRNAHYRVLANAKKIYSENLVDRINYPTYQNPVRLTYTYYAKTKRRFDMSNPCSVIDKFACDALVKAKVLEDDSFLQIKEVIYKFGGIDKEKARGVLEIEEM